MACLRAHVLRQTLGLTQSEKPHPPASDSAVSLRSEPFMLGGGALQKQINVQSPVDVGRMRVVLNSILCFFGFWTFLGQIPSVLRMRANHRKHVCISPPKTTEILKDEVF